MKAKVSVIIPAYNEEKRIEQLLVELVKQKKQLPYKIEIIVSDNNSNDATNKISKKYADKVVVEKTKGAAAARQKGAESSKGDILLFIDADCIPEPKWIKNMVLAFNNPKIVAVIGHLKPLEDVSFEHNVCKHFLPSISKASFLLKVPFVYGVNMGIRKNIFEKIGGFDKSYITSEDTILFKKAIKYGKLKYVRKAIVKTSIRRIQKMGRINFFQFHFINYFNTHLFNKSSDDYKAVR
jgi:cellulose synthase/poly-beta-1,6-N-acetylglucosamine synthase-like glycosyltransferase